MIFLILPNNISLQLPFISILKLSSINLMNILMLLINIIL